MVLDAGRNERRSALEQLFESYWYPIYAFARRQGLGVHDAQDATQGFIMDILRRDDLNEVAPERGRFRSFMMTGVRNYIANEFRKAKRLKRGGGVPDLSIDEERGEERYQLEPATDETPESLFERSWAMNMLQVANDRLRKEYEDGGQSELFDELRAFLPSSDKPPTYAELAARLGVGESAATMRVHRMRQRFGDLLQESLRDTVVSEAELAEERQHLFTIMARI